MRVLILSAPVGAGHDAAARALAQEVRAAGGEAEIDDGLALLGVERIVVGGYRFQILHAAWLWAILYRLARFRSVVALVGWLLAWYRGGRLADRIDQAGCDRVVSAYPIVSAALAALRRRGQLGVPAATLITDFDPHPGWIHPDLDCNLTVGRPQPGVISIRPPLERPSPTSDARQQIRRELGIPEPAVVALVVGGAWGVGNLEATATATSAIPGLHTVVVAGWNDDLRRRLVRQTLPRTTVLGFTERLPELMVASDVLLQNAGGMTCLEAFAHGLPVVIFNPLAGHGRQNTRQMAAEGVVTVAANAVSLQRLLADNDFLTGPARRTSARAALLFDRTPPVDHLASLKLTPARRLPTPRQAAALLATTAMLGAWFLAENPPTSYAAARAVRVQPPARTRQLAAGCHTATRGREVATAHRHPPQQGGRAGSLHALPVWRERRERSKCASSHAPAHDRLMSGSVLVRLTAVSRRSGKRTGRCRCRIQSQHRPH